MKRPGHLTALENESIYIFREVAAQFERPAILYSVGKDSSVLLHLARKAFAPAKIPFPLIHVDTSYKFPEMYEFRDRAARELQLHLIVHRNEHAIRAGTNPHTLGTQRCCAALKTTALLDVLTEHRVDAAIGGARRDEERSRAKERIFSVRDTLGQWDPRRQRPELWNLLSGTLAQGQTMRVFPLSNWTEIDVWRYIHAEKIPIVPLYFAKLRPVRVSRDGLMPITLKDAERSANTDIQEVLCRFRTLGCHYCSGAIRSSADTVEKIIDELTALTVSERSTRLIDFDVDGSMEDKKREGYF